MRSRRAADGSEGLPDYVTIMYNLCNEPWLKYIAKVVADKATAAQLKGGDVLYLENHCHRYELCFIREKVIKVEVAPLQSSDSEGIKLESTTSQTSDSEVMKAESTPSHSSDSEVIKVEPTLSQASDSEESHYSVAEREEIVDIYRFSRCKNIFTQPTMLQKGVPLPVDVLEVIDDDVNWGNVLWLPNGVMVGHNYFEIVRMLYLSPTGVAPFRR